MRSFTTAKTIARAPRIVTDPQLQNLLADRVNDWKNDGLLNLTHLVLIEVGDTDASIIEELGNSLLINPLNGKRHGEEGFVFPFDLLTIHRGYFELMTTIGNDGYARVIFVRDREGVDPDLLSMCRHFAGR